jgi:hypothetical protein
MSSSFLIVSLSMTLVCPNDLRCNTETNLSLISMPRWQTDVDGFMTVWLVNKTSNYIILIYN